MSTKKGYAIATVLIAGTLILGHLAVRAIANADRFDPFDFYVSTKLLPAGEYKVEPRPHGAAIQIVGPNGKSAFVLTKGLNANPLPNQSRLTFKQYGNASFLVGVYWAGYRNGRETETSAMERRLARSTTPASTVAIAGK